MIRIFRGCQLKTRFGTMTEKFCWSHLITVEILLGELSEHIPVAPSEGNGKSLPILVEALGGENGGRYKKNCQCRGQRHLHPLLVRSCCLAAVFSE